MNHTILFMIGMSVFCVGVVLIIRHLEKKGYDKNKGEDKK